MPRTYKLLEVKNLNTSFKIDAGRVLAVNGVSFELEKGKVLGIVGESGSGKSVTAYSVMGILDKNGQVDSGKILYNGTDLLKLSEKEMRDIRGNKISIIFQDAMTSLNPTWSIGNQLREAILTHSGDPIRQVTLPIENEIISDKQRIESMERGLANHPEREELKSDLEFVKKKLIEDQEKLKSEKARAKKELKINEKAAMKEYRDNVAPYNEAIKKAKEEFKLKKKELLPPPTQEEIEKHSTYKANQANIKAYETVLNHAKEFYKQRPDKENKRALAVAQRDYDQAVKEQEKYIEKLKKKHIYGPRNFRKDAIKNAKRAKYEFYWEHKSKYRETKYSANKRALEILKEVGITEPEKRLKQYPFELSGGMLQRCMIAMALVQKPDILIADEPTTALDVTIQAQILELLKKLQEEYGMGVIIITHDLGVVAQICDEVNIMYAGRIVERGTVEDIFYNPQHEYTKGLLNSMPKLDQPKGLLDPIKGNPVDLFCLPKGCAFSSRCKECMQICIDKYPEEVEFNEEGHKVSCWAMVKRLNEEGKIDIMGEPTGKPLIYNGAIISNLTKDKKKKGKPEADDEEKIEEKEVSEVVPEAVDTKVSPSPEIKEEVKEEQKDTNVKEKEEKQTKEVKGKKNGSKKK